MILTEQWLATIPEHLTIYTMLGSISDAKPVTAYFQKTKQINLTALWQETAYASWFDAMPYIVPIERNSPFLEWVDKTDANDWGWLAVSPYTTEEIRLHFKSLTKVIMPDGIDAFFRYWDGRHLYPILDNLKEQAGEVIPVFNHYLINKQAIDVQIPNKLPEPKEYPWWKVEQRMLNQLTEQDPTTLIDNLMQWLKEENSELFYQCPESNTRSKVTHFIENNKYSPDTVANQVLDYLIQGEI